MPVRVVLTGQAVMVFLILPGTEEENRIAEQAHLHALVVTHKAGPDMVHRYFAGTLGQQKQT